MNAETAETLLRCYRPGQTCEGRLQKAVKFAEQDPGLDVPAMAQALEDRARTL